MKFEETDPTDNALLHYGVKGMKWGVRKDGKPQGYQGKGKAKKSHNAIVKPTPTTDPHPIPSGGGGSASDEDDRYFDDDTDWEKMAEEFFENEELSEYLESGRLTASQRNKINAIVANERRNPNASELRDILDPSDRTIEHPFSDTNRVGGVKKPASRTSNIVVPVGDGKDAPFNPDAQLDTSIVRRRKLKHEELLDLDHEDFDPDEEALLHYGVKGMKWGVRKDRRTGKRRGTPVKGTKAAKHSSPSVNPDVQKKRNDIRDQYLNLTPEQQEKKASGTITDNDISVNQLREAAERLRLTNEINRLLRDAVPDAPDSSKVMQEAVNRIKLEQEYKKLTAAPPKKKGVARAAATGLLANVAKKQVENLLNTAIKTKADNWMVEQGLKPKSEKKNKSNNSGKASTTNTTTNTTNNFFNVNTPSPSKPGPVDLGDATVVSTGPREIERRKRR